MTKIDAERRLATLLIDDLSLTEVAAIPSNVPADWFIRLRKLRREFMQSLDDSIQELSFLDLSKDDFMDLLRGKRLPENLSIKFRIPLEFGGELTMDNLFMCPTFFAGLNIDRFILEQNGKQNIWLPAPAKKVYVPVHLISGGEGGNASSDRMTQSTIQAAMGGRE
ncbi:MAG: hypothetical protein FWC83_02765 [Alphaproteobacteria bacterium]|nr:hypothetical protein [Alphaproteobacteria bacterium]